MTQQEFRDKFSGGHIGDVLDYKKRLNELADFVYTYVPKFKGALTAAQIEALTDPTNLDVYIVATTGGNLNAGQGETPITTLVGDLVYYNAATDAWAFYVSGTAINV